jgi:hypothetical protein
MCSPRPKLLHHALIRRGERKATPFYDAFISYSRDKPIAAALQSVVPSHEPLDARQS